MKKVMVSLLLMCAMACCFTACKGADSEQTNANKEEDKVPVYKELTDPRGKTLESTATGESTPQIVDTLYETHDVVIADIIPTEMGYAVDPTGMTDSTAGIQAALDDCSANGGGTVFLPAGNYAISDTIRMPAFVTLRGDYNDPDEEGFDGNYGTIISVWMESEDFDCEGAFLLGESGGVMGMTVYYPLQTMECIMPYPYTFYLSGGDDGYSLPTVSNVTIINGYRGIGTSYYLSHDRLQVNNVKGTFLYRGLDLNNAADLDVVQKFTASNKYWKEASAECMNATQGDLLDAYTKQNTIAIECGDVEWDTICDILIEDCAMGVHVMEGVRADFAGFFYDMTIRNCAQGMVVDSMDERWGLAVAKSHIEGDIINRSKGVIKLCDVEVVGEIESTDATKIMIDDEADLGDLIVDYNASYKKPVERLLVADIPDGLFTDAGPELQKALDEMAAQGGGVVYVPGSVYRFRSPVTVPAGVELRGTSPVATRDSITQCNGTLFLCYYGDDDTSDVDDQAFITLAGENAGMNGIRIAYPENHPKNANINTTYTIRGTASGVYVVNSEIIGSAYGVDVTGCDNHYLDSITTSCYYNTYRLGGENGVISRCNNNINVLQRTSGPEMKGWVNGEEMSWAYKELTRETCNFIIVENATNQMVYATFAYGTSNCLTNINSQNTRCINFGNDSIGNTAAQFVIDGGSVIAVNPQRCRGYSYDLIKGDMALYNRTTINEAGEKTVIKSE